MNPSAAVVNHIVRRIFVFGLLVLFGSILEFVSADSDYVDCNCWYGKKISQRDPALDDMSECNCNCAGTPYSDPHCAFRNDASLIKLAMATNVTNSSFFSGSYLERRLMLNFGYNPGQTSEIIYVNIDDTKRHFTEYFNPTGFVALFVVKDATVARQLLAAAKSATDYPIKYLPLGILEVEVYNPDVAQVPGLAGPYLFTWGSVDINLYDVFWVFCVFLVVILGCCFEACCFKNTEDHADALQLADEKDDLVPQFAVGLSAQRNSLSVSTNSATTRMVAVGPVNVNDIRKNSQAKNNSDTRGSLSIAPTDAGGPGARRPSVHPGAGGVGRKSIFSSSDSLSLSNSMESSSPAARRMSVHPGGGGAGRKSIFSVDPIGASSPHKKQSIVGSAQYGSGRAPSIGTGHGNVDEGNDDDEDDGIEPDEEDDELAALQRQQEQLERQDSSVVMQRQSLSNSGLHNMSGRLSNSGRGSIAPSGFHRNSHHNPFFGGH